MSNESNTPIGKISLTPDDREKSQRMSAETQSQIQQDLSFLTFLADPVYARGGASTNPILQVLDEQESPTAEKPNNEPPKKEKTKSTSKAAANVVDKTETSPSATTESKDATDMWVMDGSQLTPTDLRMIQHLGQGVPLPIHPVNNLSPSLLEQLPQTYYKSLGGSRELQEMLEKAYKTQKPIRVDLSQTACVILRFNRSGQVSAEFLAGDQAAEMFFRQNLPELKNRLDSKQLPYGQLVIRNQKDQQDREKKQQQ